jgi:23S rRNA pseudouridine2605 synthase
VGVRLQKYLARSGAGSRRHSEEIIAQGRVRINGAVVTEPGTKVEEGDSVEIDGNRIEPLDLRYYILNKPKGYVSVDKDNRGRPYVVDIIPEAREAGCFPVGRLDLDTTGLMIITNDGELSQRIAHPRHMVEKTYEAVLPGRIPPRRVMDLGKGVTLEDGHFVSDIRIDLVAERGNDTLVRLTIHEGKRHVVKRIFRSIGIRLRSLHRSGIGDLGLGDLGTGEWRESDRMEIEKALR